ncbi:hypothetical protein ACFQVA_24850 [Actinomadura keratinilytica]
MDLRSVVSLYESAENLGAPVASVHLDTTHDDRLSATHIEHRWRALRDGLAEHGCDEATLTVLDKAVGGVPDLPGPQGESVFAADGAPRRAHPRRTAASRPRLAAADPRRAGPRRRPRPPAPARRRGRGRPRRRRRRLPGQRRTARHPPHLPRLHPAPGRAAGRRARHRRHPASP